tara:strand:- start:13479 stop:16760 length:3282 start_codon:yes stop_codon:yes gene_type:complete
MAENRFRGRTRIKTNLGARGQEFRDQARQLQRTADSALGLMKDFYTASAEASMKKGKEAGLNSVILSEDGMLTRMAAPQGLGNKGIEAFAVASRQAYDAAMQNALATKAADVQNQIKLDPNGGADLVEKVFRPYAEQLVANAGKDLEGHARLKAEAHRQGLVNYAQAVIAQKEFDDNKAEIIAHQDKLRDNLKRLDETGADPEANELDAGLRQTLEDELRVSLEQSQENGILTGEEYQDALHQLDKNNISGPLTGEIRGLLAKNNIMGAYEVVQEFMKKPFSGVTTAEQKAMAATADRMINSAITRDNRRRQERKIADAAKEADILRRVLPDPSLFNEEQIRRMYKDAGIEMTVARYRSMHRLIGTSEKDIDANFKSKSAEARRNWELQIEKGQFPKLSDIKDTMTAADQHAVALAIIKGVSAQQKTLKKTDPRRLQTIIRGIRAGVLSPIHMTHLVYSKKADIFYFNNRKEILKAIKDAQTPDAIAIADNNTERSIPITGMTPTEKAAVFTHDANGFGLKDHKNLKAPGVADWVIGVGKYRGEIPEDLKTLMISAARGEVTDPELIPIVIKIADSLEDENLAPWQGIQRKDGKVFAGPAKFSGMTNIIGLNEREKRNLVMMKDAIAQGKEDNKYGPLLKLIQNMKGTSDADVGLRANIRISVNSTNEMSVMNAAQTLARDATWIDRMGDAIVGRRAEEGDPGVGAASTNLVVTPTVTKVTSDLVVLTKREKQTQGFLQGRAVDDFDALKSLKKTHPYIGITKVAGHEGFTGTAWSYERYATKKWGVEDPIKFVLSLIRNSREEIAKQSKMVAKYGIYPPTDLSDYPWYQLIFAFPSVMQDMVTRAGGFENQMDPFYMGRDATQLPKVVFKDFNNAVNEGRVRIENGGDYDGDRIRILFKPDTRGGNDQWVQILEKDITDTDVAVHQAEEAKVQYESIKRHMEAGGPLFFANTALQMYGNAQKSGNANLQTAFRNAIEEMTMVDQFVKAEGKGKGFPFRIPKGMDDIRETVDFFGDALGEARDAVGGAMRPDMDRVPYKVTNQPVKGPRGGAKAIQDIRATVDMVGDAVGDALLPDMDRYPYKVTNKPPKGSR